MNNREAIEQRWSQRRHVQFGVFLAGQSHGTQQGLCRDVGIGGMYVEIPVGRLTMDEEVRVGFRLGRGEGRTHHRLPARVVHLTGSGAGLMFTEFPLETLRALRQLLADGEGLSPDTRA